MMKPEQAPEGLKYLDFCKWGRENLELPGGGKEQMKALGTAWKVYKGRKPNDEEPESQDDRTARLAKEADEELAKPTKPLIDRSSTAEHELATPQEEDAPPTMASQSGKVHYLQPEQKPQPSPDEEKKKQEQGITGRTAQDVEAQKLGYSGAGEWYEAVADSVHRAGANVLKLAMGPGFEIGDSDIGRLNKAGALLLKKHDTNGKVAENAPEAAYFITLADIAAQVVIHRKMAQPKKKAAKKAGGGEENKREASDSPDEGPLDLHKME